MSPLQKLNRLKQIDVELYGPISLDPARRRALETERAGILADVDSPPAELRESFDASKWADAFVAAFPGITAESAFNWFAASILTGHGAGVADGLAQAQKTAVIGVQEMGEALRTVRKLIESGQARCMRLRDNDTGLEFTLDEMARNALAAAGQL